MLQIKLQMFITTKSLPDVQTGWRCLLQVRHSAPVQRDPPPTCNPYLFMCTDMLIMQE